MRDCWSCIRPSSIAWRACPGVSSVSLMNGLPMTGFSSQDPIFASDHTYAADTIPPLRRFIRAAPGAFQVLGAPLVAGREYDWTDIHQKRQVVLISENFAREYWGSASAAIGKRIRSNPNDPWSEVIGVVADIRHDGAEQPAPSTVYWPLRSSRAATVHGPRCARRDGELCGGDPPRGVGGQRQPAGHADADHAGGVRARRWRGPPSR